MKWAVVAPAGSAWESDLVAVLRDLLEHDVVRARTTEHVRSADVTVLAGDEAWCGTFVLQAKTAETVGRAVADRAKEGALVLAIDAGFAAACSLGLLPGSLQPNEPDGFQCRMVDLRVENAANAWAERAMVGDVWRLPVRTAAGRYAAEPHVLDGLERDGLVLLRYLGNPNGSARDVAAVLSPRRNVLGILPHPENVVDASLVDPQWPGLDSGRVLFESVADWVEGRVGPGSIDSER